MAYVSLFFVEYFMTVSVSGIYSPNDRWLMNDGLGRIFKEVVLAYSRYSNLPGGTKENH
jgi:hypothetical protein